MVAVPAVPARAERAILTALAEAKDNALATGDVQNLWRALDALHLSVSERKATVAYLSLLSEDLFVSVDSRDCMLAHFSDFGDVANQTPMHGIVAPRQNIGARIGTSMGPMGAERVSAAVQRALVRGPDTSTLKTLGAVTPTAHRIDADEAADIAAELRGLSGRERKVAIAELQAIPTALETVAAKRVLDRALIEDPNALDPPGRSAFGVVQVFIAVGWLLGKLFAWIGESLFGWVWRNNSEPPYFPTGFAVQNERYETARSVSRAKPEVTDTRRWLTERMQDEAEGVALQVFVKDGTLFARANAKASALPFSEALSAARDAKHAKTLFANPVAGSDEEAAALAAIVGGQAAYRDVVVESRDPDALERMHDADFMLRIKLDLPADISPHKRRSLQRDLQPDIVGLYDFDKHVETALATIKVMNEYGYTVTVETANPALVTRALDAGAFGVSTAEPSVIAAVPLVQRLDDASQLNETTIAGLVKVRSEDDVSRALARARDNGLNVSIASRRHTMDGQSLSTGNLVLDMNRYNRVLGYDDKTGVIHVQAGAHWSELLPYLDRLGRSPAVQQSHNVFTVGGSISVNSHGSSQLGPISSSVQSFHLMLADGRIVNCSDTENPKLFHAAMGGYGLYGVILDACLYTIANQATRTTEYHVPATDVPRMYDELIRKNPNALHFGGDLSVGFDLDMGLDAVLTVEEKVPGPIPPLAPPDRTRQNLVRMALQAANEGKVGRQMRWWAERYAEPVMKAMGSDAPSSINNSLNEPAYFLDPENRKMLALPNEYFIPMKPESRFAQFIVDLRRVCKAHNLSPVNLTVRGVAADNKTLLAYAKEDSLAIMALFVDDKKPNFKERMAAFTREMSSLYNFYLPYRVDYTAEALRQHYPGIGEALELRDQYDPTHLFGSQFWTKNAKQWQSTEE